MVSYAQNYEDVMLRRCFRDRKDGFYIDVGAMDPVLDSVTKFFYDEGWSGINLEPNEFFYNKLMQERPRDINLKLAAGEREESRILYAFEQHGISTFDASHRDRFVEQGYEAKEVTVRTTTLALVCQEYVKREIEFLKVDCEGWEHFALSGFDWERFRPILVLVEATEPLSTVPSWSEWEHILTDNGRYEMVYFDGLNRFYLRREYSDLRSHFSIPPNVFDAFTPYAAEQARQKSEELAQERDAVAGRAAELAATLDTATTENLRLADLFHAKEVELEAHAAQHASRIAELDQERIDLQLQLQKTRLWVGQLSQDLAAARNR